ncbi:MAG: aldolase, partial [bacterium]
REVDHVIQKGADYVMLPFFQCLDEVKSFHALVKGRVKTILLVETDGAVNALETIINNSPPDEIHIGLNDLSICLGQENFFSLFLDGTVESIAARLRSCKIPFGIGGVAALSRA